MKINLSLKILLFFFFVSFFIFFYWGHFYTSDEMLMAMTTKSIVEKGSLQFEEVYGKTISRYGIGVPIAAIPFFLIDKIISIIPIFQNNEILFINLLNVFVTSLLGVVIFLTIKKIFNSELIGILISLITILTTDFLPNSRTLLSEPLFSMCLLSAFYYLLDLEHEHNTKKCLIIGFCLGSAVLTRFIGVILIPIYCAYIFFSKKNVLIRLKEIILISIPVIFSIVINMILNQVVRGNFFNFGYEDSGFTNSLLSGIYALLFSIGRGFFIYNPMSIFAVVFLVTSASKNKKLFGLIFSLCLIWIIFHSKFFMWWAGWTYGSRFLDPIIPFLFIPLGYLFSNWKEQNNIIKFITIGLIIYSIIFQIITSIINPMEYNNDLWSFMRSENEFLFIPQMSSLFGMDTLITDGRLTPAIINQYGKPEWILIFFMFVISFIVFVLSSSRLLNYFQISIIKNAYSLIEFLRIYINQNKFQSALIIIFIILSALSFTFKGTRGLTGDIQYLEKGNMISIPTINKTLRIIVSGNHNKDLNYNLNGYINIPIPGKYTFFLKVYGQYDIQIGDKIHFKDDTNRPQHLNTQSSDLEKGLIPFSLRYKANDGVYGLLYLYWSLPGAGVWLEPIKKEYILTDEPTTFEHFFTLIYRNLWAIFLIFAFPIIVFLKSNLSKK